MKTLVVYYQVTKTDRNTIFEHLYSFSKYSEHNVTYLNVFNGVPPFIGHINFDVVIFHYTFLSQKLNGRSFFRKFLAKCGRLKKIDALKIAMPQDEYVNSDLLCEFFNDFKIDILFTCFYQEDWEKVYPKEKTNIKHYFTTLTGYVDDFAVKRATDFYKRHAERAIDVGYRARKLPFWLGEHGTVKWRLTEVFQEATQGSDLVCDLSNSEKKVFLGDDWYRFLSNCRVVLGCEGGASLLDVNGKIRQKVESFMEKNPDACFEEVRGTCFPREDNNINLFAISPRHFDACITRTTQVLVEGQYYGIFEPGTHYIELKKDWSNIQEVLLQIKNREYCEEIAENAYRDVILSRKYTYESFVRNVFEIVSRILDTKGEKKNVPFTEGLGWLSFYCYPFFFKVITNSLYRIKVAGFYLLKIFGLVPLYRRLRSRYLGWEY